MTAAADAASLDDMFLRLEASHVMMRVDTAVVPTMAKTPTLGRWELDLLRTITRVVRMGHVRGVTRGEIVFDAGVVRVADDALIVHCAASGLQYPPLVPVWQPDAIRLQGMMLPFFVAGFQFRNGMRPWSAVHFSYEPGNASSHL